MLGIGLSHQIVIEDMFGLSFDKPLRHMREYLVVLVPLLDDARSRRRQTTLSAHIAVHVQGGTPAAGAAGRDGPRMLELAGAVSRRHGARG